MGNFPGRHGRKSMIMLPSGMRLVGVVPHAVGKQQGRPILRESSPRLDEIETGGRH